MKRKSGEIRSERFEIVSEEGLPIRGVIEAPENPSALVIALHGFKGFKDWAFFPWLSSYMAKQGLAFCRFDFSRSGVSEGADYFDRLDLFADDTYSVQLNDVASVVRHLESLERFNDAPTSILGYSRGGAVALLAAESIPRLQNVATWSSISTCDRWDDRAREEFDARGYSIVMNARTKQEMKVTRRILDDYEANREKLDVIAAVRRLHVPLLLIHGEKDETVDASESRLIARNAKEPTLLILKNASHTLGAMHPLVTIPRPLAIAADVTARFFGA